MIKVFTDYHEDAINHDKNFSFSIERIKGIKLLRKYRKAFHANSFFKSNKNIKCVIADHWKSLELIKTNKKKICLNSFKRNKLMIRDQEIIKDY